MMLPWIREKLAEWYILVVGLVIVGGGLALGWYQPAPGQQASQQTEQQQRQVQSKAPNAAPQPSAQPSPQKQAPKAVQRPPPPLQGIQTVTAPAGGAVITEFKLDVPGNYTLVDHALARAERGLLGVLHVEGPPNPEIYNGQVMPGMGH